MTTNIDKSIEGRNPKDLSKTVENTEVHKEFFKLEGLKFQKEKIEAAYREIFPKVDPYLIHDVLLRMQENPKYKDTGPMYTVEVFAAKGTDSQMCKDHIWTTTGKVPGVYDKGTHYVTHMRLTPEILKKLNDFDFVLEVMAEYAGSDASIGPIHDVGDYIKRRRIDDRNKNIS
jgi:hypothetical protein